MQELLTLKEIAQELDVPESNLRYYRNRISEFLPSAGRGRRRRYLPEAKEVFRRTVELIQEGMTLDRVYKYLASNDPHEIESLSAGTNKEELLDKLAEKIKDKITELNIFEENNRQIDVFKQYIENSRKELETAKIELKAINDEIRERDSRIEKSARRIYELEKEIEQLRQENAKLDEDLEKTHIKLEEKERIIEFQKKKLIEGREKRLGIDEELRRIRMFMESSTGVRSGGTL